MEKLKHEDALASLKFLLECAFINGDEVLEAYVYEKLALCHYYLADIDKSRYYITKASQFMLEPVTSEIKICYRNLRKNYDYS